MNCRLFFFLPRAKDEPPPFISPPPFRSRPLNTAKCLGERCISSPSGVWGDAPTDKPLGAYWSQKVQLWWQQFLLIFLRTNAVFCTKTSLISYGVTVCIIDCQWHYSETKKKCSLRSIVRRPMRSFYPGAVATMHCRMEVVAYDDSVATAI